MAKRIHFNRFAGESLPERCKLVTRPGLFGNPFDWRTYGKSEAIRLFAEWLAGNVQTPEGYRHTRARVLARLHTLKGYDLACSCKLGEPCHADVLIELVSKL